MTAATAGSPPRFVRPEEIRSLARLLKQSAACIESEIRGGSMGDTLPSGTRVNIHCGEQLTLEPGQIIAFLGGARLIAHRLCGRGRHASVRGFLLTRGDATALCDAPVHVDTVLGIVTARRNDGVWQDVPSAPAASSLASTMRGLANLLLDVHPALAKLLALVAFRVRNTVARMTHRSA